MPHFHVPLQSGSDKTLKLMRRRYKRELYADRVDMIKSAMPHACIGVDVIVGFPGETDEDFKESFDFISSLDVSYLHVFTYSERANTLAAEMGEVVPVNVRRQRNEALRNLSIKKKQAFYQSHLGTGRLVLFEKSKKEGLMTGFTDNYIKVELPYDIAKVNQIDDFTLGQLTPELTMTQSK